MSIEATVGPHRQLSARSGSADPADRLTQEVGGPPGGVGTALAQPGHEHVTAPGRNREQRVVAAHAGVAVVPGALLRQAIGLADRRVEVDGEWRCAGSRSGRPGPGEQLAGHAVELADVAPAEAAQKRAQGRWGLDGAAEDAGRPARAQRIGVVDAVTARERGGDQGQQLVPDVRPTRGSPEVEVGVDELLQTEMLGERGRQQQPRVGHQAVVVEGCFKPVEAMR